MGVVVVIVIVIVVVAAAVVVAVVGVVAVVVVVVVVVVGVGVGVGVGVCVVLPHSLGGQAWLVVGHAHLQQHLQDRDTGDRGGGEGAYEENRLRLPWRPRPCGRSREPCDVVLWRLEDEDAALRGTADERPC